MIQQSLRMALKAIMGNKMRSFLTVLGIVIGVMAVGVLTSIAQGTTSQVTSSIESMGTNLLTVNIRGYRASSIAVTLPELTALEGEGGLDKLVPVVSQSATAKAGSNTFSATVEGTVEGYDDVRNIHVAKGRFLKQADLDNRTYVAVVGVEVADELFGQRDVVGETLSLEGYTFSIVGVLEEKGSSMAGSGDSRILIPFTLAERLYSSKGISTFYASAESSGVVNQAQATLESYLSGKFKQDTDAYSVFNQTQMLESLTSTTQTLTLMLAGIAGISLLVGGIGIMNIMLVSVSERTREIGIRKAIGAGRWDILLQFLIEALVISLLGGILGLGLSIGLNGVLSKVMSMTLVLSGSVAQFSLGFAIAIGVIFGLYPANKASVLQPIQALRYDG